jgi:hypothetical protein
MLRNNILHTTNPLSTIFQLDRGFEPRSGQTKDYKIGICCFSAKHAALRRKQRLVDSESG